MNLHKIHLLRVIAEFVIWELAKFLNPGDPEEPEIDAIMIMPLSLQKQCAFGASGRSTKALQKQSKVLFSAGRKQAQRGRA